MLLLLAQAALPAQTWASCDTRCDALVARDVDRDGFDDVCVRLAGSWQVARTVSGWKASPWVPAASLAAELEAQLDEIAAAPVEWAIRVAPPPYERAAPSALRARGDLDHDGDREWIEAFRCSRPGEFFEIRVAFEPGPNANDRDGDGLSETDEARLRSNPLDRDSDNDGLLDGWELAGLPRVVDHGGAALDPTLPDVLCAVAPYEGVDRIQLERELARAAELYAAIGVRFHWRMDSSVAPADQAGGDWAACGARRFPSRERGLLHWMQVTPWGGGQAQQTGDMGGCGQGFAVFAHEFGHQLSLSHTGDSEPAWCPLYPSLMNYAFNYALGGDPAAVRFSNGEFRELQLDETRLTERVPFAFERVKYLAAPPFRFTLAADGPTSTKVDWNHDGAFSDEPVAADINYGGSTSCGVRRDLGGVLIGAAPSLAYVDGTCYLATLDTTQANVVVRAYRGSESWDAPRALPTSSTNDDPLLVGAWGKGWVFLRRTLGWQVCAFDAQETKEPAEVAELPLRDLSVALVAERLLCVTRDSDDALEVFWLDSPERLQARPGGVLDLRSQVPVGIGVEPSSGRVVLASAAPNARSVPMCLRVSWFELDGDLLRLVESRWVRGESSGTNCTTRPVIAFDAAGQLNVFHTGMPQADGQMTAWRTRRIGNAALDEGWLTCLLYDVWTRTRRPLAFACGPQGALFAFRWDAAEAHGMRVNQLLVAHDGFGLDRAPMRDFDDGEQIRLHGLVHSLLWMRPDDE